MGTFGDKCKKIPVFEDSLRKIMRYVKKVYEIKKKNDTLLISGILPQNL